MYCPSRSVRVVVDLFNTVYRLLVLFLHLFPPPDVSAWWWTYLTRCITYLLLLLYSRYSNVFVSHPDVSAWWRTYLTRCIAHWYCFYVSFTPDVSMWWWTYLPRCITYWYCCYCTVRTVMSLFPTQICPRGGRPI